MIKIGFSSAACPTWDLETIVTQAAALGYDGIELRGLAGELYLPTAPALAGEPRAVRELFGEHKVELVCLGTSATLTARRPRELARQKAEITEYIELAGRLGCPLVRLLAGDLEPGDVAHSCLVRMASALQSLAPVAARHGVTLVVENGGDFPGSQPLWYLADAAGHPCVRVCWNQCHAMTLRERPTVSIPRLSKMLGLVHVCDATFDEAGVLLAYKPPAEGDTEVLRQMELLRGVVYRGYVVVDWPKLWVDSLSGPEQVLPAAAKLLREKIEEKQAPLTAYKGDKYAPRLARVGGPEGGKE